MSDINNWNVVAANNNATPPDGWPENTMQYSEVNDAAREMMAAVARYYRDTNGSVATIGTANAYSVTLNQTYSSLFSGMYFSAKFHATNTGASTINVNGIGASAIKDRAGNALSAGEIQAGGIYELRYDGVNFQLMGTIVGTASLGSVNLTNSNAPDLVDTDVALNVGAADPTTSPHVEVGPAQVQAKASALLAAALSINALGGDVFIASGAASGDVYVGNTTGASDVFIGSLGTGVTRVYADGDLALKAEGGVVDIGGVASTGRVRLFHDGVISASSTTNGLSVYDTTGDSPTVYFYQDDLATAAGRMRFGASQGELRGLINSQSFAIYSANSSGTNTALFYGHPDNVTAMYYAGQQRLSTAAYGAVIQSAANTDTEDRYLRFSYLNGTVRGHVGHVGSSTLSLRNVINSGAILLQGNSSAGAAKNIFNGNPDGAATIYNAGLPAIASAAYGATVYGSGGVAPRIDFYEDDLTTRAGYVQGTASIVYLKSTATSGQVRLVGTDAADTAADLFVGDPDGAATLFYADAGAARTKDITAGGFEVNNTLTGTGWERVLTESDASPSAVSGFTAARDMYLSTVGGSTTSFDVDASIPSSTAQSVGPTGSGADNIWTALNSLPANAKAVLLCFRTSGASAASGAAYVHVYASDGSSTLGGNAYQQVVRSYVDAAGASEGHAEDTQVWIPLDSSRRFKLYHYAINSTEVIDAYLKGFAT